MNLSSLSGPSESYPFVQTVSNSAECAMEEIDQKTQAASLSSDLMQVEEIAQQTLSQPSAENPSDQIERLTQLLKIPMPPYCRKRLLEVRKICAQALRLKDPPNEFLKLIKQINPNHVKERKILEAQTKATQALLARCGLSFGKAQEKVLNYLVGAPPTQEIAECVAREITNANTAHLFFFSDPDKEALALYFSFFRLAIDMGHEELLSALITKFPNVQIIRSGDESVIRYTVKKNSPFIFRFLDGASALEALVWTFVEYDYDDLTSNQIRQGIIKYCQENQIYIQRGTGDQISSVVQSLARKNDLRSLRWLTSNGLDLRPDEIGICTFLSLQYQYNEMVKFLREQRQFDATPVLHHYLQNIRTYYSLAEELERTNCELNQILKWKPNLNQLFTNSNQVKMTPLAYLLHRIHCDQKGKKISKKADKSKIEELVPLFFQDNTDVTLYDKDPALSPLFLLYAHYNSLDLAKTFTERALLKMNNAKGRYLLVCTLFRSLSAPIRMRDLLWTKTVHLFDSVDKSESLHWVHPLADCAAYIVTHSKMEITMTAVDQNYNLSLLTKLVQRTGLEQAFCKELCKRGQERLAQAMFPFVTLEQ